MQANWKRISSLILVFAIVFTTLFNGVSMETVKAANAAITVDVTNLDAGATYTHNCSKYAVNKYDATYHWKACSVCGKVIAGTKTKHSLKDNGWTMGSADVCSGSNHHVYTCSCGYSKNDDTGRAKHTYKTPCNCWGRHTHYHCTVCGNSDYKPGVNRYEECISVAKVGDCFTSFTCPTCGAKYVKNNSTKTWNIYNIDWKNGGKTATHKTYEPDANSWNFSHNRLSRFGKTTSDAYLETDNEGVWCQDCGLKLIKSQKSNYQIVDGEGVFTTVFTLPDNAELFSTWCNTTLYGTSGKYYSMDTSKQFKLKTSDGKDFISKGTNFEKIDAHTVKITSYIKLPTTHTEVPETISHEFQYKINGYRYRAISFCKYDVKNDGVVRHCIVPEKKAPTITSAKVTPVYSNGADGESWATGVKLSFAGTENYCNSVTLRIRNANGSVIKTVKINVSNKNWAYNASLNLEGSVTGVNYTIEVEDSLYNVSAKKTFTVKKTDAKAPTVTSSAKTGTDWSKTKSWTASATDDGVGNVSIAFHKTSDNDDKAYVKAVANNSSYSTNYIFTGDVYGSKSINVVYKDGLGNETSKAVTISNLDNTAPTITDASTIYSENNETKEIKTGVKVTANDEKDFNGTKKSGSGIAGYAISTTNTVPSNFQASNVFSVTKSGTYYVFVKDNVGNVSAGKKVNVNVKRKVTFNYNKPVTDSALTGNETAYKYVAYNTAYGELPTPGLLGYTFNGWFTANTAGTQITSKTTYATDSDTTAYAHWTLNNYSITYNLNADDATISGQPTSYNVNTKSFALPTPVRKGYTFTGWTGSNGTDLALTVTIPKGSTGNKSYKAHWRANKLIVTYNKNGGIIDKNMSNYSQDIDGFSQEWQYNHVNANGGTTEDPINFSSFGLKRRDGYVRRDGAEWNTKPDGTGRSYDQDKSYTMTQFAPELEKGDVNLVLYAQWQPAEYSITYDLKGGSLSNQKTSYNVETATFTIPQPTKNGYTFTGWTGSNGTTPQTNVTVTKGSMDNKTYTANWSPIKYSITYNLDGGSLSGQKTEYTIETEDFTIPQPTKKGYIFSGWTGSNGSTAQKNVTIKKGSTGNRAYTANWAKNAYNLKIIGFLDGSYNANVTGYGTFDVYINGVQAANDCSFYNNTIPYGSKWEIKDIRTTTGHYYNGIRLGSATGTLEDKDTIVTLDFSTKKTVVTFYRNYNSSDSINESQTFVYGSPNQAFANINWKRQGYTLIGWSEDRNATTKMYDLTYPVSNGWILSKTHDQASSTVALYSVWQRDTYSISYDLKGGSINTAPTSYNVETGTFTIPQPTKNGYTFTGWTGSNGKVPNTSVSIQKGSVGNRSYTANWAPITYSITYDLKGGTASNLVNSYNIETASFSIPQPTKDGYTFTGWSGTGIQSSSKNVTVNQGSIGNRTYTANWTPVNYGITYNLNGGTASGLKTSYTVETASFTLATPVKSGYTFIGWTGSNGTTPQTNVVIAQGSKGNRSYTANWNKIEYSITYDLQGGKINNAPTSYNVETAAFHIPQPTKNGYTFTGWSGTGLSGLTKDVVVNKNSVGNRHYEANWQIITYSVTYNLDGGSISGQPTKYTVESATLNIPRPTKAGHTFLGWTGSNGSTNQMDVSIAHGSTGNKSYTAHWKINTYTMTVNHYKYNQRTGEWDIFKVTKDKADYGTVYIPGYDTPANYYNHHRDWDKGWTVTGDASFGVYYYPNSYKLDVNVWLDGVKGNNGSGYSDIRFNVYVNDKLTAQNVIDYSASLLYGDTYKIEMIANSKYTYEKQAYEGTVKDNVIVEPKVQTVPVVERTACVQSGNDDFYAYAYISSLGSLDRVVFPSWTDEAGQDDLNPHWQSDEKADEKGNWTVNGQTYNYRKLIKSANHKVSGRDEHNWYNIHIYAYNGYGGKTVKTTTFAFQYNVGFNYNKPLNATSVVNNASENTKIVVYNTAYGTLPKPSMTGWTFNGWYTAASGGNKVEETNVYKHAYGTILYAHWTANTYRVNFDYNKPSNASGSIERNNVTFKNVTYDSAYGDLPSPALTGWRFNGWYTERTGGKLISKTTIYNIVAGDQTLYAHWTANTYTISFNKNQPSKASRTVQGTMNQIRYTYDSDNQKLPANRYSLTGWEFIGWKTSSDGTGKLYTDMDSIRNITSTNGANITMYAQWKQKTYTITFVYQDNKTQNTKRNVIFDSNLGNTVNPPIRTGYDFDYWCVKNNDHEGIHVYDNKGRWVNENSHTFWSKDGNWNHEGDITVYAHWTDRKTPQNTYLRAVSGNEICGTAGEIELGQNPTEVTPVIAKVTTYLQKPSMISGLAATLEGTDRNNILNGWQTEWFNFKDKNGNEKPVTLTLHSEDDGSGIANLSIIDSTNNAVFKTQNFNNAATGNISKDYISSQEAHFNGKAVDKAGNSTNTANLIIKGDRSMPYAASYSDGSTGFVLMTGTLDNPIGKQDNEYNGSCRFGHEIQNNLDSSLKNTDGVVTGVNDDGMRTEILAKVKDNGSGVKYVWAVVSGREGTKIYPCRRSSKDKDVYVAVNGADHGSDKGKLPNLYTDFKQSTELSVYMFTCDEAGNVAQIHAKDGNGVVTNFSMYNQIIRDDRNFPSTHFTASGYGPYFLLGQSGNIHIVTYGYVDSVDIEFPAELQAAALADKANPNLSAKVLGTKRMVKDADIGNRIQLLNDTTQNNCTRIADYAFVVPLSLNSDAVKNFMVNPEADADGNYNALPASGNFKLKNIAPDGTVSYNAAFCLSGNEQAYAITTETAYKNSDTLISKAYFKCGNSESETDNGESITQKIHTHLVN